MNYTLTAQIASLVETLRDLRHRLRQSAQLEVARAVGDALREVAFAVICGPAPIQATARPMHTGWEDDPWRDPAFDQWTSHRSFREEPSPAEPLTTLTLSTAVLAGLGIARWSYVRSQSPGLAASLGILSALGTVAGGPSVRSLLEALSVSQELLRFPGADRKP
jgi:hypothetical protein